MTGAQLLIETLAGSGVRYLFGNPGSTELPLMEALGRDERIQYILGLHEIPVMAMADACAQATRTLGVVNLHASCGVGNAMGMLYNSWCSGTPLLVTAGQQDSRLLAEEPVLGGDTCAVTRPWTKCSLEAHRAGDIAGSLRRAIREALTPPTGPVFLSLPVDLQREAVAVDAPRASSAPPECGSLPAGALGRAVQLLVSSEAPVLLAGNRVIQGCASDELARLAHQIGAPIYSETHASAGRLPVASDHPLYAGALPLWSHEIRRLLEEHDTALVVGMSFLREYVRQEPASPLPDNLKLVQLDVNEREIGKNYPVEVGLAGDIKSGLIELSTRISAEYNWSQLQRVLGRRNRIEARREDEQKRLRRELEASRDTRPMRAINLAAAVGRALPMTAALVEEAPTTNQNLIARLGQLKSAAGYFGQRGWALGWGAGAAVGVKLAWPERPVVALLGDGAALYGIQALWTAAHYRTAVVFVVAHNAQYKILKDVSGVMGIAPTHGGRFLGMDITEPEVDYVKLAESFGVAARRVEDPDELTERIEAGLQAEAPLLLEAAVER